MNSLHTPAARQPHFACSHCVRRFFNRAGLKNHVRAKHPATDRVASQSQSPSACGLPSPQQSNEQFPPPRSPTVETRDAEFINRPSSIGTEDHHDFIQPPLFDDDDYNNYDNYDNYDDYGYQDENNIFDNNLSGSGSRSSTPISVPSSQDHARKTHAHQQKPADNKYLRKIYHPKLNGKSSLMFRPLLYLLDIFMVRSNM
jgi:hypothetical protein